MSDAYDMAAEVHCAYGGGDEEWRDPLETLADECDGARMEVHMSRREIARLRAEVERLTRERDEARAWGRDAEESLGLSILAAEVRGAAWMREALLAQMSRARETYRSRAVDAAHAGDEHAENTWRACTDAVSALAGWLTQRDPEQVCDEQREREE